MRRRGGPGGAGPPRLQTLGGTTDPTRERRRPAAEGALQAGSKAKRNHSAKTLERLGARPQKGPRMSASIGVGLAKSRAKKAAKARQEAVDAGMGARAGGKRVAAARGRAPGAGAGRRRAGAAGPGENKLDGNGVLKLRGKGFKKKR